MNNPRAPTTESQIDNNKLAPPLPALSLGTAKSSVDAGLSQYQIEAKANQKQLAECEDFKMKLYNDYYNHHKILIELITESKKLLIKYKTGDNEYYYLAEYISSVLDKPNCNNPSKPYKNYTDFLKDYRPTLKVKIDDKDEEIQLMDFQSVDGLKESIIPFNSGEKYLGNRDRIVGLNLPPVKRPNRQAPSLKGVAKKVIKRQKSIKEVDKQDRDGFDNLFGGKKRKKKKKKKRNNKTNRRKKKKNGTKKKRN
tara:strand:- start:7648 stop:8406 length:759 start_codon:yes stop_codon:yes gene_type:complete